MSYQVRSIEFTDEVPSNADIVDFIESNSAQEVVTRERGIRGQYTIHFKRYPRDKLDFDISRNGIAIAGDAGAAPAVCEILYSCQISLGGIQKVELPLLEFPVSDVTITALNRSSRKTITKFAIVIWLIIALAVLAFGIIFYLVALWLLNT